MGNIKRYMWLIGLIMAFSIIGLLIGWGALTNSTHDLFLAALGLLTFTSIFYSIMLSGGTEIISREIKKLKEEKNKKLSELKGISGQSKASVSEQLRHLADELEKIEDIIKDLNLNRWLFFSVGAYLLSITAYLLPKTQNITWTIGAQIITFWIGLTSSMVIIFIWFLLTNKNLVE